jgi:tetratricopeptide (TPR) repeat protein
MPEEDNLESMPIFFKKTIVWYFLLICIFVVSTDFEMWHRLRLGHLHTIHFLLSGKNNPYDGIRYYEYLIRAGLKNADNYTALGKSYMSIGEHNEACKAFRCALKYLPSDSQEYASIVAICGNLAKRTFH